MWAISSGSALRIAADLAQGRFLGVGVRQVDVRRGVEAVQQVGGAQRVAEAAQAVELGERADQFGLVVGVLVVAVPGVHGDAAGLLVRVTLLGLLQVGVHLEEGEQRAPAAGS